MGGADIIPGVSGGPIALVLGIYERLVKAISHVDGRLFRLIANKRWREAALHLDLRFLIPLAMGILTGIVCLAKLMRYLLLEHRMYTLAVFFGLILASSLIVARMVRPQGAAQRGRCLALAAAAALLAYWLVGLNQLGLQDHLGYFLVCGSLAICAMILPGISGAYILWLLGAYVPVTEIIDHLFQFQATQRELITLVVFVCGCALGLLVFSKLLRWLLARAHMPTMAVLGGFMVGSLRGMWPFQIDLTPEVENLKLKQFERFVPEVWDQNVSMCVILALIATLVILGLDRWGRAARSDDGTKVPGAFH